MRGNDILLGHNFYGDVNSNSYLDILDYFILPQLQELFNNQFENGSF